MAVFSIIFLDKNSSIFAITIIYILGLAILYFGNSGRRKPRKQKVLNDCGKEYQSMCKAQRHLSNNAKNYKNENKKLRLKQMHLEEAQIILHTQLEKDKERYQSELEKKDRHIVHLMRRNAKLESADTAWRVKLDLEKDKVRNKLNEANNQLLSLNGQLIQVQQQSNALADRNEMLESQLRARKLELSELQEKLEAYKNELTLLEDNLTKHNEVIVSLEDKVSQLEEELTASKDEVASLEETLNNREDEIRQHEEILITVIEHVMSGLDDLCRIHNESLEQSETSPQIQCHLSSLTEPGVSLPTPPRYVYYH